MHKKKNLFADFPSLDAKDWQEKVVKELKGKPFDGLQWQVEDNLTIAPFYHQKAETKTNSILLFDRDKNDWSIGEPFSAKEAQLANKEALEALGNGTEAPSFVWDASSTTFDLATLLKNIECAYISTHFETPENHLNLIQSFYHLQNEKGANCNALQGSINGFITEEENSGIDLLKFGIANLPQFQLLTIANKNLSETSGSRVEELAQLLSKASDAIYFAQKGGIAPEQTAPRIQFEMNVGTSYFPEMAKLRALRLLWPLLLKGFGVEEAIPAIISVGLNPNSQVEDRELNLIRSSTQAMSAVLGGADRLTILPPDAYEGEGSAFAKRMARNIQHILKLESYLDRVLDPAEGSYYIETLTHKMAEKTWQRFQEIEKEK